MSRVYYVYEIKQPESDHDVQLVQVGDKSIELEFQWAIASAEQLTLILRKFNTMANNDPIVRHDGTLDRSYSYLEFYYGLALKDLNEWLDTNPELPRSLAEVSRSRQLTLLQGRIELCVGMMPTVTQYIEVMRWQVRVTCGSRSTVAVVQPGGWFQNQDESFAFRFLTSLQYVGEDDLGSVIMQFEVYDE